MSGVFGGKSKPLAAMTGAVTGAVEGVKTATQSPAPEPTAPAATAAAGLGETRAPVTRATTMLSNRRAGDDVRVGTKKLLGQ